MLSGGLPDVVGSGLCRVAGESEQRPAELPLAAVLQSAAPRTPVHHTVAVLIQHSAVIARELHQYQLNPSGCECVIPGSL